MLFPVAIHLPHATHGLFDPLLLVMTRFGIHFSLHESQFALKFAPVFETCHVQCARVNRCLHRAARLALVATVSEAALRCQRLDIHKGLRKTFVRVPELQFAQAWSVHEQSSVGQRKKFSSCCCVSSTTVGFTDFLHFLGGATQKAIHDRGLAHS